MSFNNLNIHPSLLKALDEMGYTSPTPVQQQAIPYILDKRDIFGCAQTGTGKTAAFVVPLLQLMMDTRSTGKARTLVIAPTRELALQITESIRQIGKYTGMKCAAVFGGVPQPSQVRQIRAGIDLLVATPGRLKDLTSQGLLSLQQVQYLVLDEADRMLDMGFVQDVKRIIAQLPSRKQTLFFSATVPSSIMQLAGSLLHNPVKVQVTPVSSTVDTIGQFIYYSEKNLKPALLTSLLQESDIDAAIVFTQMKHMADKISKLLNKSGIASAAIHGNRSQRQREAALDNFKSKQIRILVATDIAARGIDIDKLSHVINYDLPQTAETYVHRIGRTGRAGAGGTALSFCSTEEKPLLAEIQKLIRRNIPVAGGQLTAATSATLVQKDATGLEKRKNSSRRTGYATGRNQHTTGFNYGRINTGSTQH